METKPFYIQVADEVRAELARQRKTGRELAILLGLSRNSTYRRLNGEIPFDLVELEQITNWLGRDATAIRNVAA